MLLSYTGVTEQTLIEYLQELKRLLMLIDS